MDDNDQTITNKIKRHYNNKQDEYHDQSDIIIQDSDTNKISQECHGQVDIHTDSPVSKEEITTMVNHKLNNFDEIGAKTTEK